MVSGTFHQDFIDDVVLFELGERASEVAAALVVANDHNFSGIPTKNVVQMMNELSLLSESRWHDADVFPALFRLDPEADIPSEHAGRYYVLYPIELETRAVATPIDGEVVDRTKQDEVLPVLVQQGPIIQPGPPGGKLGERASEWFGKLWSPPVGDPPPEPGGS